MTAHTTRRTKLILCQRLGDGRRLVIEIAPDDTITATPWDGSCQVGKPVQIRLSKAPRMAVLVDRVRQALAQQPVTSPDPAPPAPTPWLAPTLLHASAARAAAAGSATLRA